MKKMTLGSLFDGSGGFPLAARMCGIEPVWASEIEPYPIRVTKKNFPNMKHYGDITKINGAEIEPVDIITFGSPCQDISVAGYRKGMQHTDKGDDETTRSGLFFEAIRVIKEMRDATQGTYPNFIIYENVPGVLSSSDGNDFWTVLKEIHGVTQKEFCIPRLEKWTKAGAILGDGCSLAWRTMDSQFFGVPHIRRRVYIVADFRGYRAEQVLFKRDGLPRHFSEVKKERQKTSPNTGAGTPFTIQERNGKPGGGKGILIREDRAQTLDCLNTQRVVIPIKRKGLSRNFSEVKKERQKTSLYFRKSSSAAITHKGVVLVQPTSPDGGAPRVYKDCTPALRSMGESAGYRLSVCQQVFENHGKDCRYRGPLNKAMTLDAAMGTGGNNIQLVTKTFRKVSKAKNKDDATTWKETDKANTLNTFDIGETRVSELVASNDTEQHYGASGKVVRRLTPLECCRLQGFPDDWCDGVEGSDSAQYKMWGNGVALPVVYYIMYGIAEVMKDEDRTA